MFHRRVSDELQKLSRLLHRLPIEQFGLQIFRLYGDFVQHDVYWAQRLHPPRVTGKIDVHVRRLAELENITETYLVTEGNDEL